MQLFRLTSLRWLVVAVALSAFGAGHSRADESDSTPAADTTSNEETPDDASTSDEPKSEDAGELAAAGEKEDDGHSTTEASHSESPAKIEGADDHSHGSSMGSGHGETSSGDEAHGTDAHGAGGHGAEATHDDPMHANATDELESVQEFRADLAIVTFVIFLLLMAILGKFAWKPIAAALDAREKGIAANIDESKHNAEESRRLLAEHEAKLAAAADEVRDMLAQARRDAEAAKERIVSEAQQAAARERDRAVADIQAAKSAALGEVAQKSADMAFTLASRIVRRELKPEDHSQLVREAIEQMPSKN